MLMIRLARFGARKQPYYRVVVIEKERARNGRPVEVVGTYNPRTNPATVDFKRERIDLLGFEGRAVLGARDEAAGNACAELQSRQRRRQPLRSPSHLLRILELWIPSPRPRALGTANRFGVGERYSNDNAFHGV